MLLSVNLVRALMVPHVSVAGPVAAPTFDLEDLAPGETRSGTAADGEAPDAAPITPPLVAETDAARDAQDGVTDVPPQPLAECQPVALTDQARKAAEIPPESAGALMSTLSPSGSETVPIQHPALSEDAPSPLCGAGGIPAGRLRRQDAPPLTMTAENVSQEARPSQSADEGLPPAQPDERTTPRPLGAQQPVGRQDEPLQPLSIGDAAPELPAEAAPREMTSFLSPAPHDPAPRTEPADPQAPDPPRRPAEAVVQARVEALAPDAPADDTGRVQVTLHQEGEEWRVVVSADNPITLDLMRRHADQLQQDLAQQGFTGAQLDFSEWSEPRPPEPADADYPVTAPTVATYTHGPRPIGSGLDLRL